MEPSCSRQPTDINEEAEFVPNTTHTETKTGDIEIGDELEASSGDNDNIQPLRNLSIDEIERKDFELENRLINLHSQEIEDTECLTASSNCDEGISCANSSTTYSNENKCSLILNAVNDECNVKIDAQEVQFELNDEKKSNTPDNCCLKKNHVYTMNFTPPKPVRPYSIPKYKLFEFEEVHEESEQSKPCENNEDVFETCNNQSIDCQSNNSKEICLDPHENDSSSSNVYDLSNGCERIAEDCDEMIDKTDHNYSIASAKFKDSFDYMNQTGHGSSHGLNTKDLLTTDDSEVPSNILSNEHSMLFPDYEDPDTGEAEEDEVVCTCVSSFNDNIYVADDKQICDDDMASLSMSDSEVPNHSVSENSRLLRKRKVKTSPTCSSTKKQYIDVTAEPKNAKVPEYPPEGQDWLNRFSLWSGSDRLKAIDLLIGHCAADQVRHMMQAIEPLFQRDFISLLPRELALAVLGYLMPKDLLRAAHTCKYWRYLADDNLLWKEQCRRINVAVLPRCVRSKSLSDTTWKAAYIRQHMIEKNWLRKPTDSPKILKGHDDHVITCLQFYGNKIVSGSDDTTLKVWSAITGRCLRTLVGHTGGVWSSQMIGRTIISGSTDRTLRIWDANTGACLRTLTGHTSTVRCMHLCNDKVVSGSRDATLRVWSVPDGRCLRVLVGHMAAVRCVQYNGNRVVSGAYDYFVKIWNPDTAECLHTLAGHSNRVYSLQFDGVHIVTGSLDTSIMVWDVESGALKHTLRGHQSITSGMELRSNILMSGNADSTVKIWDIISGQCLHTLTGQNKHQSAVTCVQSNNRFVITSSDDGTVKLWDLKTGEFIRNLVTLSSGGSGGVVWRIRASSTKLVCAVGSRNGTEDTKLMVLDFDIPGACSRCDIL